MHLISIDSISEPEQFLNNQWSSYRDDESQSLIQSDSSFWILCLYEVFVIFILKSDIHDT